MKQNLLLFASLCSLALGAQTSLQVTHVDAAQVIPPNGVISVTTAPAENVKITLDIKNTSNSVKSYYAKRYDVTLNSEATSTAVAYFCFAGKCFGDNVIVSEDPITLNAGQSASQVAGQYQMLVADLDEAATVGFSEVRYTFYNAADNSDSIQVRVEYNGVVTQNFSQNFGFPGVTQQSGTTDPSQIPAAVGVSFGSFAANGVGNNPTGTGIFSYNNWSTGAGDGVNDPATFTGSISTSSYYEFVVTPQQGFYVTITGFSFDSQRSATGPRMYAVRGSADSYAANLPAAIVSNTNLSVLSGDRFFWNSDTELSLQSGNKINLPGSSYQNFTTPRIFRIYAWNAEDAVGSFGIDNVKLEGIASTVVTGIGQLSYDLAGGFSVYPNPNMSGVVNILAKQAKSVEILNMMGSVVYKSDLNKEPAATVNMSDMPSGTYVIRIFDGQKYSSQKLVLVR